MNRLAELAATALAGGVGSLIAVLAIGAGLAFVVPIALGVGAVALAAGRAPHDPSTN